MVFGEFLKELDQQEDLLQEDEENELSFDDFESLDD